MNALVRGDWKEGKENVARFPELEKSDFERICEFAYRGDYEDPEPTALRDSDFDEEEDQKLLSDSIADRDWDIIADRTGLIAAFIRYEIGSHRMSFRDTDTYPTIGPGLLDREANGWPSGSSNSWMEDITSVLLGHARLHVFADKYMIQKLKDLSLHKLHKYLTNVKVYPLTRVPIIELLQYAYQNLRNHDGDFDEEVEPLRMLVLEFIALHRRAFREFPDHVDMLKQDSEYAVDFADKMLGLLNILEE